jgi:hypothetical protein
MPRDRPRSDGRQSDDGHGHAGHSHGVSADADRGKLTIALGLILGCMAFEVAVGIISHSLALLSDAAQTGISEPASGCSSKPRPKALTLTPSDDAWSPSPA